MLTRLNESRKAEIAVEYVILLTVVGLVLLTAFAALGAFLVGKINAVRF